MYPEPRLELLRQFDTVRLIPARFLDGGDSVLAGLAADERQLQDLFELDHATNQRLRAEHGRVADIGPEELVFGVPYWRTINASFCHPHPLGSRFSDARRGAWYAGFEVTTSLAEVIFHRTAEYAEIDRWVDSVDYVAHLADFSARLHDLRGDERYRPCLDPSSYRESQLLAAGLFAAGSLGIVYPSVRAPGGTCVACFRPALVQNVRRHDRYRLAWSGTPVPSVTNLGAAP